MPTLTIYRGISGSGKSTKANRFAQNMSNVKVVSRDKIREDCFGVLVNKTNEPFVTQIQDAQVATLLSAGYDVILDITGIEWDFVQAAAEVGYVAQADVVIESFDVPLGIALNNNRKREKGAGFVPEKTICSQHQRLARTANWVPAKYPAPYYGTPNVPDAILFDVDDTLTLRDTSPERRAPGDGSRMMEDWPREGMIELVNHYHNNTDVAVIIATGRDETHREVTTEWLHSLGAGFDLMLMRPEGNRKPQTIVKGELFDTIRNNYNVIGVYEDQPKVAEMWSTVGVQCFRVEPRNRVQKP